MSAPEPAPSACSAAGGPQGSVRLSTLMLSMVPLAILLAAMRGPAWLPALVFFEFAFALRRTNQVLSQKRRRGRACGPSDLAWAFVGSVWRVAVVTVSLAAVLGVPFLAGLLAAILSLQLSLNIWVVLAATICGFLAGLAVGPVVICRFLVWLFENYWEEPEERAPSGNVRVPLENCG